MPRVEEFTLASKADGLPLSCLAVLPDSEPVALLQIAHGMAEHKERYLDFMRYMAENGYACFINDHRGHGGSVRELKDLGYMYENGASALVEDMHALTLEAKRLYPGLPFFLMGHSMGSLAVRAYRRLYDNELDGLLISGSPSNNPAAGAGHALASVIGAFKGQRHRSKLMNKLMLGAYFKAFQSENSDNHWLNTKDDAVAEYDKDPLCGFVFTINGYKALIKLMQAAYDEKFSPKNPDLRTHFISGKDDPCYVNAEKFNDAVESSRRAGYKNVSSKLYDGLRHEILNEANNKQVYADILSTLESWRNN